MAYGVKYQCEWTSPMREQRRYIISILERNYEGAVLPLYPRGDVLTITQGQIDADELQPIKASEASLSLLCIDEGDPYLSLFTTDPLQYKLLVERYYGGLAGTARKLVEWEGYLSAGVYSQNYANPPYHVSLRAADGIAILKDKPFLDDNGKRYEGLASVEEIISVIMSKISDMRVTYPWAIGPIAPEGANALSVVGLESTSLYSSFGTDKVVSCYELLESILQSLGLQLFQSYGTWVVRPLASLATTQRAKGVSYINNGYSIMPLYTDRGDDTGVSTSSTLSLLPPYSKMEIGRPDEGEGDGDFSYMLNPSQWVDIYNARTTRRHTDKYLRLKTLDNRAIGDKGFAYILNTVSGSNKELTLSVSFDCYNLSAEEKKIRVGLFAFPALRDPVKDLFSASDVDILNVNLPLAGWDGSKWVTIKQDWYWWLQNESDGHNYPFGEIMRTIELPAAKKYIFFEHPAPLQILSRGDISVSAALDLNISKEMRFMVVVAGEYTKNLPPIELRAPEFSLQLSSGIAEDLLFDDATISSSGLGEITYNQHFADQWVVPVDFRAAFLNVGTGDVIRGLVSASDRPLLADVAVANIRLLRGQITRQIEGECYAKTMLDLDAMWRDREGRVYYTNYIRRHLKRGLYTVQLREMPAMAAMPAVNAVYSGDMTDVVGLDTSAYWLSVNARQAWRYDAQRDSVEMILSAPTGTYAMTLNAGQRAVSVVTFDGVYYALRAYDTHGELLSHIERLNDLTNVALTSGLLDSFARSARFDANTNTWVLIGGDSTVTYLQMLSRDGESYGLTTYSLGNYRGVVDATLMPNGFAYTSKPVEASSTTYAWWHSNAQHFDASVAALGSNLSVVACNEMYIAIANAATGSIGLHHRTDAMVGYDAPLVEFNTSQVTFVAMNNALALFRRIDNIGELSYGAWVYDGRTGNIITLTAPLALPTTKLWISGNRIYGAWVDTNGAHHFTAVNIISGDGTPKAEFVMPADDFEQ